MLAFGKYTRDSSCHDVYNSIFNFQREAVNDWNGFCNNVTLSYNMGFVGVHEDSSDGAAAVILDMLLNFGVLVYNQDESWSLH